MKSIDGQLEEVLLRAEWIRKEKAERRGMAYKILTTCAGLAIVIMAAFFMPAVTGTMNSAGGTVYGSIILVNPWIGYILIAALALVLGMFVSLLCMHIDKGKKAEP